MPLAGLCMPPIKWMWRCHGAPPVLFVHSVSNSSANPGWFVIHPVSLRTKPVPCRPRRSVAVMPHLHIGPRTTYTSSLEDMRSALFIFPARCTPRRFMKKVSPLLSLFLIHITRCVEVMQMQCFFHSFLSDLWQNLVPTYRLQVRK